MCDYWMDLSVARNRSSTFPQQKATSLLLKPPIKHARCGDSGGKWTLFKVNRVGDRVILLGGSQMRTPQPATEAKAVGPREMELKVARLGMELPRKHCHTSPFRSCHELITSLWPLPGPALRFHFLMSVVASLWPGNAGKRKPDPVEV